MDHERSYYERAIADILAKAIHEQTQTFILTPEFRAIVLSRLRERTGGAQSIEDHDALVQEVLDVVQEVARIASPAEGDA